MKIFYCSIAFLSIFSLNAAKSVKPKKPSPDSPVKIILKTKSAIEIFTKEEISKTTLNAFAKAGTKIPTTMSTTQRIAALLNTFDSLDATLEENGKKAKLSDKYREWEQKMIDKVVQDKKTYGLAKKQIVKMLKKRKDFNKFLKQAIATVKKQEKRR